MKVAKITTQTRRDDIKLSSLEIASYGDLNDYPQKIKEIFNASPTGKGCLNTAVRFVFGNGFKDLTLANYRMNEKDQKGNQLLKKIIEDFEQHGGYALHINYNGMLEVAEIQHIPFEHCRIGITNDGKPDGKIAVYDDWGQRNKLSTKKASKDNVKYYPVFNPIPEVILAQLNGNPIEEFSGQILYFSNEGHLVYPLSPFDATVTDMSTEESISTVLHRNARYNFLPAGMIVKKKGTATTNGENEDTDQPSNDSDLENEINSWQGDERAAKMLLVTTEFDEEAPAFVPFAIQNFDRMFDSTSKYVQDTIGRMFMQPPILRGVDVGAGFGADLMKNAYDFYNSIVESERKMIEQELKKVFTLMPVTFESYDIQPLQYINQTANEKLDK